MVARPRSGMLPWRDQHRLESGFGMLAVKTGMRFSIAHQLVLCAGDGCIPAFLRRR